MATAPTFDPANSNPQRTTPDKNRKAPKTLKAGPAIRFPCILPGMMDMKQSRKVPGNLKVLRRKKESSGEPFAAALF
jgi:hypothetical protein